MSIALFSAKSYDQKYFDKANEHYGFELCYLKPHLTASTAELAKGCSVVCAFANDGLDGAVLKILFECGIELVSLRCAGYDNVDLAAASQLGIRVVRVPAYSPYAIAEHAVALMLALNRKIPIAHNRIQRNNFSLEGLIGFDMRGKTVGIIGTGRIGIEVARILNGFGCTILAVDLAPGQVCLDLGVTYVDLETLCHCSDIITLHCPLTPKTRYLINAEKLSLMKPGVMLINTSRGAIVETQAVIEALQSGQIGYLGLDVYEKENAFFFEDCSDKPMQDEVFQCLRELPNVLITGHQGFFTHEAMTAIAETALKNIHEIKTKNTCQNEVFLENK